MCAVFGAAAARADAPERGPYLQRVASSRATVVWTTREVGGSVVRFGDAPDALDRAASGPAGTQHEVELTGLAPGSRVYYAVGDGQSTLAGGDAEHFVTTPPVTGEARKFRAWVLGDSGTGGAAQRAVRDAMLAQVGSRVPELTLHLGDLAYHRGTTSELTTNFFVPYRGILGRSASWPTLGNHEGRSSDSGTESGPYYEAFVLPRGGECGGLPSGTEAYYAFDWANVHFLVLDSHDSDRSPSGPMLTWAKADLEATKQAWIVAYWHHPPYSKGTHDSDVERELVEMREHALPVLEAGGVDLVLAGHSHIYERSKLVDGAYATPTVAEGHVRDGGSGRVVDGRPYAKPAGITTHNGAVYVVAGHGGASVGGEANHPLMHVSEVANGSCLLDVHDNRLAMINVRADGVVSDRFTLVKGDAIVVGQPDGGERLEPGSTSEIAWATVGRADRVDLAWSSDEGATWQPIAAGVENAGRYVWTVPEAATTRGLVRVSAAGGGRSDESNATFAVGQAAGAEAPAPSVGIPSKPAGCACAVGNDSTGTRAGSCVVLFVALVACRRRRRRGAPKSLRELSKWFRTASPSGGRP